MVKKNAVPIEMGRPTPMAEARIEDLYFVHEYEGSYYGYRQDKCFRFDHELRHTDTYDVKFPYSTKLGCPVWIPTLDESGVDSKPRYGIVQ